MSIISISRGSNSYGKEIAEKLARQLGYECISREILLEASEQFHVPEIKLVHAIHDSPTILDRFTFGKEKYIAFIRAALFHHLQKDNVIYHGLAGHFFLQKVPHALKVRIIADMDKRIAIVMKRDQVSAEAAQRILTKDDEERRKWSHYLYGIDTTDSRLYDIVLRIGQLTVDDAIKIIVDAVQQHSFKTTAASQQIIDDMALAAQVEAELVTEFPGAAVSSEKGRVVVTIRGPIDKAETITDQIKKAMAKREGIEAIEVKVVQSALNVNF